MSDQLRKPVGKKYKSPPSFEQYQRQYELKRQGLERVLGKMHDLVGHAIIAFEVGGAVDMYFPNAIDGTRLATMELIEPDGSGPKPSSMYHYRRIRGIIRGHLRCTGRQEG
jgi:hypothetical protein